MKGKILVEMLSILSKMRERLDAHVPTYDSGNEYIMSIAGRFVTESRQIALLWKEAFPDRKLVIVFGFPRRTINKQSKTTYAGWCERHQIEWREAAINSTAKHKQ